jgi:hypothetical protein
MLLHRLAAVKANQPRIADAAPARRKPVIS